MELLNDPITLFNLILCIIIVIVSIIGYMKIRSATPLFIGAAFFLFGVSHAATLLDLKTALELELIVVRAFGYIAVCIGLFLIIRDIMLRMKTTDELKTVREGLERRVEERTEEIKRANELLRQSEARFQIAMEQLPGTLWVVDTNLVYTLSQGHGLSSMGLQPDQVVGKSLYEFFGTDDPGHAAIAAHLKVLTGESVTYEYEHKGETFQTYLTPMYASGGQVTGAIGIAFDITERKRAEERIRWLASFPELNPNPVIEMDEQGTITFANAATLKTLRDLGLPENPALFVPENKEDILRLLRETGESLVYREFILNNETFAEDITLNHELRVVRIYIRNITAQKEAEEALRENEETFKALAENANDGILIAVDTGVHAYANKRACEIIGYSVAELQKTNIKDLAVPDELEKISERFRKILRGEPVPLQYETTIICKDRKRVPIEVTSAKTVWHGQPADLVIIRDITERKRTEEALRKERDFAKSIVGTAQAIVLILDTEGHIVYINPYMEEISGYILEEVKGKDWFEMFLPSHIRESVRSLFQKAIGDIQTRGNVDAIITKDGHERLIEWYDKTLKGADGSIEGLLAIGQDITDKKKVEEALLESEERFRHISSLISNFAFSCVKTPDSDYAIDWLTGAVEQITGYSVGEIKERLCWRTLVIDEDLPVFDKKITGFLPGESASSELRIRHKTGEIVWLDTYAECFMEKNNPVSHRLYGACRDITERKKVELELVSAQQRLNEAHRLAHIGTWDWVMENDTVTWSEELYNIAGRDPSLPAPTYAEHPRVYTPASWDRLSSAVTRALTTGEPYNLELELVRPDGSLRWINAFGGVKRDGNGKIIGLHGTLQDITERKRVEEAINDSERRLSEIINFLPDATFAIDKNGTVISWNRAMEEMTGVPAAQILGKGNYEYAVPFYGIRRPILIDLVFSPMEEISEKYSFVDVNGDVLTAETVNASPQGKNVIFWGKASPLYDKEGNITGAIESIRDITERKKTDEVMQQTNEYLHKLIDYASAPIIVWDPRFRITRFNDAFDLLTGRTEQEVIGQPLDILFPKESRDTSLALIKKTLEGERWESVKIPILAADGTIHTVLWNSANILTADAELVSTIAQGVDITQSERAEEALRESENRYRSVVEDQTEFICRFAPDGMLTFVNDAYCRYFGLNKDRCIGSRHSVVLPVDDARQMKKHLAELTPENPVGFIEHRIIMPSGEVRWQRWSDRALFDKDGHVVEYQSVGKDITERKQAEDALRESEERYHNVIEDQTEFICRFLPDGTHIFVNNAYCRYFDKKREEILGHRFKPVIHPEDREIVARHIASLTPLNPVMNIDQRIVMPGGSTRWQRWSDRAIFDKAGHVVEYQSVGRDITERKQAQFQREMLIKELEQKNAELERFTYTVSHDLKSPLITIRGFLGLLEKDALNADTVSLKKDINRIKSATNTMEVLLRDLLTLSRIGRIVSPPAMVSFTTIAEDAVELLDGAIQQREVTVEIAPDMPVVNVDRDRVREAVVNLVENAIKFMGDQPHPKIGIGVRYDRDQPVFFVKDNGIGIDPQYHTKIFLLFEKLSTNTEGSGTGLAIVQRIIEVHGGRIWVESEGEGKGTTFCFTLPVTG